MTLSCLLRRNFRRTLLVPQRKHIRMLPTKQNDFYVTGTNALKPTGDSDFLDLGSSLPQITDLLDASLTSSFTSLALRDSRSGSSSRLLSIASR